ncbi:hypothetical protein Tco_1574000 [Tanacetum coccineum]
MNPGSSRMPNDDKDGDDQDGNDEDGNANNEDGNGSDESSSKSDDDNLLICPIWISKVLIDAPWLRMAASAEARISLIKLEFSSCLFADSLMNLLRVSYIDCLRSWYEGLALFL